MWKKVECWLLVSSQMKNTFLSSVIYFEITIEILYIFCPSPAMKTSCKGIVQDPSQAIDMITKSDSPNITFLCV
jgi:hypothetical protein